MPDTIADLLSVGTDDAPALLDTVGTVLTYQELRTQVSNLAAQLRTTIYNNNDGNDNNDDDNSPTPRIAISLPNGIDMALTFLAATAVGCAAPLNPKLTPTELNYCLNDLRISTHITDPLKPEDQTSSPPQPISPLNHDDLALVLHTSGTTAKPKIVPLTQRNLTQSAQNIAKSLNMSATDRSLNVMPLFHVHGLMAGLLAPLSVGGSVITTPGFDAFKFFGWLKDRNPTYYTAVPTMHQLILARSARHQDTAKRANLRFIRSSSAALPTQTLTDLQDLFDAPVIEAYGMTEATHQICSNPLHTQSSCLPSTSNPSAQPSPKPRSVGVPSETQITILDPDGTPIDSPNRGEQNRGEPGEIAIKGSTVFSGYEATATTEAFTDGWFRTGDEGFIDADGYLFLTGRLKEQINRGGEKISPLEIDEALLSHPAIAEAATFAIPHDQLGEDIAAAIVLKPNTDLSEADLRSYLSESLAAFKVPRTLLFADELPKSPTGKIQRSTLATHFNLT